MSTRTSGPLYAVELDGLEGNKGWKNITVNKRNKFERADFRGLGLCDRGCLFREGVSWRAAVGGVIQNALVGVAVGDCCCQRQVGGLKGFMY